MIQKPQPGGPILGHQAIAADLGALIVSGKLKPGSRLPLREQLAQRYGVSYMTVQRAVDRLSRDGFVRSRKRAGTFVVDHPPHLFHYAIVFRGQPSHDSGQWSRFWTALVDAAGELTGSRPGLRLDCHYGVDEHADNEQTRVLTQAVRSRKLAGLIFPTTPHAFIGHPILEEPGISRVTLGGLEPEFHDMGLVQIDSASFLDAAALHLRRRGCRRIGVITSGGFPDNVTGRPGESPDALVDILRATGAQVEPHWVQVLEPRLSVGIRRCVHLLMHQGQPTTPDALILADDHFLDPTLAGLSDAGRRVGSDVEVVAWANFPSPAPPGLPVERIGFDARQVLRACLDVLERSPREVLPLRVRVPCVAQAQVRSGS